jgi:hypothetical protein
MSPLQEARVLRDEHTKILRRWVAIERARHADPRSCTVSFEEYLANRRANLDRLLAKGRKGSKEKKPQVSFPLPQPNKSRKK